MFSDNELGRKIIEMLMEEEAQLHVQKHTTSSFTIIYHQSNLTTHPPLSS